MKKLSMILKKLPIILKKLPMIKQKLPMILIIIGALIAAIPIAGQLYAKYQEDRMLEEWLNSIDAGELEDTALLDPEAAYSQLQDAFGSEGAAGGDAGASLGDGAGEGSGSNESGNAGGAGSNASGGGQGAGSDQTGGTSGASGSGSSSGSGISDQKVLGIIQIKKIKVKEPIVEGVSKANLRAGIGHIPGTAALGQNGNCALAGHRNYAFKKFFRRLDELEAGDEIIITTKKEDLKYTVTGKIVVTPDDVSVLAGNSEDNIISLITCTPVYVASHRLIVTAELTDRVLREP